MRPVDDAAERRSPSRSPNAGALLKPTSMPSKGPFAVTFRNCACCPSRRTSSEAAGHRIYRRQRHCRATAALERRSLTAPMSSAPPSAQASTRRCRPQRRTAISSPTRLQAQRLMFEAARRPAARLLGGLRSSSCSWWVEYSQRVGTQLYWNRWAAHGARRAARCCFSKKRLKFNGADGSPRDTRCLSARDSAK